MRFTVYGNPVAKGRPKFRKQGSFVKTYTPEKTLNYENLVKISFDMCEEKAKLEGQLKVTMMVYCTIPKSTSKKKKELMLTGKIRPTKKPDLDNITKSILDALNGRAFDDDKQVVSLTINKYYSAIPRVEVEISEV
ncbi:MAG: RusA family crossover junction endodeoxyribonuclease [Erysipelotrichaceae bacterium]|nr:RusA family crossover junction endodeoxyribonuclease [Erysipelotrichaceae bacterium]